MGFLERGEAEARRNSDDRDGWRGCRRRRRSWEPVADRGRGREVVVQVLEDDEGRAGDGAARFRRARRLELVGTPHRCHFVESVDLGLQGVAAGRRGDAIGHGGVGAVGSESGRQVW